jgi:hypothetical protein
MVHGRQRHRQENQRDGQVCYSDDATVPLSLMPQTELGDGSFAPPEMSVYAEREPEWQRAAVVSSFDGKPGVRMTPAEARRQAAALLHMAEAAGAGLGPGP